MKNKTFSKSWWREALGIDEIKINKGKIKVWGQPHWVSVYAFINGWTFNAPKPDNDENTWIFSATSHRGYDMFYDYLKVNGIPYNDYRNNDGILIGIEISEDFVEEVSSREEAGATEELEEIKIKSNPILAKRILNDGYDEIEIEIENNTIGGTIDDEFPERVTFIFAVDSGRDRDERNILVNFLKERKIPYNEGTLVDDQGFEIHNAIEIDKSHFIFSEVVKEIKIINNKIKATIQGASIVVDSTPIKINNSGLTGYIVQKDPEVVKFMFDVDDVKNYLDHHKIPYKIVNVGEDEVELIKVDINFFDIENKKIDEIKITRGLEQYYVPYEGKPREGVENAIRLFHAKKLTLDELHTVLLGLNPNEYVDHPFSLYQGWIDWVNENINAYYLGDIGRLSLTSSASMLNSFDDDEYDNEDLENEPDMDLDEIKIINHKIPVELDSRTIHSQRRAYRANINGEFCLFFESGAFGSRKKQFLRIGTSLDDVDRRERLTNYFKANKIPYELLDSRVFEIDKIYFDIKESIDEIKVVPNRIKAKFKPEALDPDDGWRITGFADFSIGIHGYSAAEFADEHDNMVLSFTEDNNDQLHYLIDYLKDKNIEYRIETDEEGLVGMYIPKIYFDFEEKLDEIKIAKDKLEVSYRMGGYCVYLPDNKIHVFGELTKDDSGLDWLSFSKLDKSYYHEFRQMLQSNGVPFQETNNDGIEVLYKSDFIKEELDEIKIVPNRIQGEAIEHKSIKGTVEFNNQFLFTVNNLRYKGFFQDDNVYIRVTRKYDITRISNFLKQQKIPYELLEDGTNVKVFEIPNIYFDIKNKDKMIIPNSEEYEEELDEIKINNGKLKIDYLWSNDVVEVTLGNSTIHGTYDENNVYLTIDYSEETATHNLFMNHFKQKGIPYIEEVSEYEESSYITIPIEFCEFPKDKIEEIKIFQNPIKALIGGDEDIEFKIGDLTIHGFFNPDEDENVVMFQYAMWVKTEEEELHTLINYLKERNIEYKVEANDDYTNVIIPKSAFIFTHWTELDEGQFSKEWWNEQLGINEIKLINHRIPARSRQNSLIFKIDDQYYTYYLDQKGYVPVDTNSEESKKLTDYLETNKIPYTTSEGNFSVDFIYLDKIYFDTTDYTSLKENQQQEQDLKEVIKEFVAFAKEVLGIKQKLPGLTLSRDTEKVREMRSMGYFNPSENKIWVYVKNRNKADILRTLAHELVHRKQEEDGRLKVGAGDTGSEIENEANAQAGILLRNFGKINKMIYESKINEIKILNNQFGLFRELAAFILEFEEDLKIVSSGKPWRQQADKVMQVGETFLDEFSERFQNYLPDGVELVDMDEKDFLNPNNYQNVPSHELEGLVGSLEKIKEGELSEGRKLFEWLISSEYADDSITKFYEKYYANEINEIKIWHRNPNDFKVTKDESGGWHCYINSIGVRVIAVDKHEGVIKVLSNNGSPYEERILEYLEKSGVLYEKLHNTSNFLSIPLSYFDLSEYNDYMNEIKILDNSNKIYALKSRLNKDAIIFILGNKKVEHGNLYPRQFEGIISNDELVVPGRHIEEDADAEKWLKQKGIPYKNGHNNFSIPLVFFDIQDEIKEIKITGNRLKMYSINSSNYPNVFTIRKGDNGFNGKLIDNKIYFSKYTATYNHILQHLNDKNIPYHDEDEEFISVNTEFIEIVK